MAGRAEDECLFCRIRDGSIPAKIVYRDELALAFPDIRPQAPTHILVIPNRHVAALSDAYGADRELLGHLQLVAAGLARRFALLDGFRVVINSGAGAGQSVFHLHLHLLGGRALSWPPG